MLSGHNSCPLHDASVLIVQYIWTCQMFPVFTAKCLCIGYVIYIRQLFTAQCVCVGCVVYRHSTCSLPSVSKYWMWTIESRHLFTAQCVCVGCVVYRHSIFCSLPSVSVLVVSYTDTVLVHCPVCLC
jgi:hypothetical protein